MNCREYCAGNSGTIIGVLGYSVWHSNTLHRIVLQSKSNNLDHMFIVFIKMSA